MKNYYRAIQMLVGAALVTGAQASPFQNGSFETGPNPGAGFAAMGAGNTTITGWTVGGTGIDYISSGFWQPSEGSRSLDLNETNAGSVAQTFDTVSGATYSVLFDMAGNPNAGPAVKSLRVTAAASSTDYTFDVTGRSNANMGWSGRSFLFTATSASTTLTFSSLTTGSNAGPALDNVRVTQVVPEPATLAALGLGLVGLVRRRRR